YEVERSSHIEIAVKAQTGSPRRISAAPRGKDRPCSGVREVAEGVAAQELAEGRLAPASPPQDLREPREIGGVAQPARQRQEAVEVGPQRDRVLAADP